MLKTRDGLDRTNMVFYFLLWVLYFQSLVEGQAGKRREVPSWLRIRRGPISTAPPKKQRSTTAVTETTTPPTTKPIPTTTQPTTEISQAIWIETETPAPPTPPPPNATAMSMVLLKGILVNHGVIPEVLLDGVRHELRVSWSRDSFCHLGEYLSPKEVTKIPQVRWPKEGGAWYSLLMMDLDWPAAHVHKPIPKGRKNWKYLPPTQYLHWAVLNIWKGEIRPNNTMVEYIPPRPANNSGNHRIVFIIYKQRGEMNFDAMIPEKIPADPADVRRQNFKTRAFAQRFLLTAFCANFFRTKFEG